MTLREKFLGLLATGLCLAVASALWAHWRANPKSEAKAAQAASPTGAYSCTKPMDKIDPNISKCRSINLPEMLLSAPPKPAPPCLVINRVSLWEEPARSDSAYQKISAEYTIIGHNRCDHEAHREPIQVSFYNSDDEKIGADTILTDPFRAKETFRETWPIPADVLRSGRVASAKVHQ